METTAIRHIVVIPHDVSEQYCTVLQGFSRQVVMEYGPIFSALSIFPHDIFELLINGDSLAKSKMAGSPLDIYLIKENLIDEYHIDFDRELNVFWSTKLTLESGKQAALKFKYKPIHISTEKDNDCVFIGDLSEEKIVTIFNELISEIIKKHPDDRFKNFLKEFLKSDRQAIALQRLFSELNNRKATPEICKNYDQFFICLPHSIRLISGINYSMPTYCA